MAMAATTMSHGLDAPPDSRAARPHPSSAATSAPTASACTPRVRLRSSGTASADAPTTIATHASIVAAARRAGGSVVSVTAAVVPVMAAIVARVGTSAAAVWARRSAR
jgi:hypothetical protein